jgi:hypothetical protein
MRGEEYYVIGCILQALLSCYALSSGVSERTRLAGREMMLRPRDLVMLPAVELPGYCGHVAVVGYLWWWFLLRKPAFQPVKISSCHVIRSSWWLSGNLISLTRVLLYRAESGVAGANCGLWCPGAKNNHSGATRGGWNILSVLDSCLVRGVALCWPGKANRDQPPQFVILVGHLQTDEAQARVLLRFTT